MIFTITHTIYGDRTVFGYSGKGAGDASGVCSASQAIDLLNTERTDYDWTYTKWDENTLIVEFEKRKLGNQIIETIALQSEGQLEKTTLINWEKNNGFV